mmetsp:Transcript_9412/g.13117  ORF Transcript_9412/g.13117 Transcript_9412/m.13117 type:complete len:464 (+) Transcript_9412:206-1597(+)|eukprot:CAMPEP_0184481928 /NCGR_PEP_ID=MMETSP0113_2-20130426/3512_1 /TAXON_ID=91329 /ORGANISM="Norrisiella sphaerica, Strain BC52" /LENGTH=463 /DNA_ID=CAMNT_0026861379 /DNA_START=188 /DNA_END=1579 /DNA_ORIENTATION=+
MLLCAATSATGSTGSPDLLPLATEDQMNSSSHKQGELPREQHGGPPNTSNNRTDDMPGGRPGGHLHGKYTNDDGKEDDNRNEENGDFKAPEEDGLIGSTASRLNANVEFEMILSQLRGQRLAVFLDYDGTLTPIVDVPSEAKISNQVRSTVEKISKCVPTAIITGRSVEVVKGFVGLRSIFYAGSHGFDIRAPGGEEIICQVGKEFLPLLGKARDALKRKLEGIQGCLVEDNKYSISVHYRLVAPEHRDILEDVVRNEIAESKGKLKLGHGKMVYELRASVEWHKGKAVRHLLKELQDQKQSLLSSTKTSNTEAKPSDDTKLKGDFDLAPSQSNNKAGSSAGLKKRTSMEAPSGDANKTRKKQKQHLCSNDNFFALYIGDDVTDEDAFRELARSKRGIGIRVLSKGSTLQQPTAAKYILSSVSQVQKFLERLGQAYSQKRDNLSCTPMADPGKNITNNRHRKE